MSLPFEFTNSWLQLKLDVVVFVIIIGIVCYACVKFLGQRGTRRGFPAQVWALIGGLTLISVFAAEWAQARRRDSLGAALVSFAPTYAHQLRALGHARITFAVSPDDPAYAALLRTEGEWLRLNPTLGELFTFRVNGEGRLRIVADAANVIVGQVYPTNSRAFLRAVSGETFFDPQVHVDARGAWMRAFAPVRDPSGRIEAGLVLSQPASDWQEAILISRGLVLGGASVIVGAALAIAAFVALVRARMRAHADTERELQNAKIAADEASRAKSDFLAVMSHEIRTPLNAVMGFANLLSESKLDEAQRDYVATITSEGLRLGSLVNDLLDLSKIEEGRLVLERLPFAPAETAHEILRLLSARAQEKRLELRFEAQLAGPLLVAGDPLRFRQILVNLVDNAIKFTPRGSVTLFLQWTPPKPGEMHGFLGVRVRDTGIGIAADKLGSIFDKFIQVDASMTRRYGGTGLGLAICQRLVGLMGGRIRVESSPGNGAEFAFTIPVTVVPLPEETARAESEPAAMVREKPPRILVVDDMETNRFLLEIFLRRNGFNPDLASGGEEAVRLAAQHHYDGILMDLQMPDVDGYMAARRIRAAERPGEHTPIIALTASIGRDTRAKCLAAGMDEHLTKPLDLAKFKALLNALIQR